MIIRSIAGNIIELILVVGLCWEVCFLFKYWWCIENLTFHWEVR